MRERRVVYEVPGMDRVRVRKDVTYKVVEETELQLDVYSPPEASDVPRPTVVFVHGGMWDGGPLAPVLMSVKDWGQYVSYGELLAASELVAVTFNHRSQGRLTHMATVEEDILDLLAYVREHASELAIDPERLCVWSISLGVPFGVAAAAKVSGVRCLVAYYGPLDLRPLGAMFTEAAADELAAFSPMAQIVDGWPPMLIARAEHDHAIG